MLSSPIAGTFAAIVGHCIFLGQDVSAFSSVSHPRGVAGIVSPKSARRGVGCGPALAMSTTVDTTSPAAELGVKVSKLKRVLTQEYISFFDPMVSSWYAPDVSFDDPMTSLSGVDSYQDNVDMLSGRTLMGKFLFDGAGINLHSVTGGKIGEDGVTIDDIQTRWTLRVTVKVLPWKPEAVFSGVSVYKLKSGGKEGISIVGQTDYWDSINIKTTDAPVASSAWYEKVDKFIAIQDFLGQLRPEGFIAPTAAPELPYLLLRRGDGYEVRRYPGSWASKQRTNVGITDSDTSAPSRRA